MRKCVWEPGKSIIPDKNSQEVCYLSFWLAYSSVIMLEATVAMRYAMPKDKKNKEQKNRTSLSP